ncbi:MAG: tetratricopeptide repeat protein [Gemmatimonadota bacterium]|nr:MAG: tetratricopeptide repeat protein [Gemmatimonadota bacterium]
MKALDEKRIALVSAALVALLAVGVYANSLSNGFAYDDDFIIKLRGLVHGLGQLPELLTAPYWPPGFTAGLYRPLLLLSFAVDWAVWGGDPFGFHLVNVLLHAVVSVLVLVFLRRLFPWWAALIGALIFAVHAVHTEAVANIVGRGELIVAIFALVACLIFMRSARQGQLSAGPIVLITSCFVLASLTKELGVVIPGLLLATDLPLVARRCVGDFRSYIRRRLPLFIALTVALVLVFVARWLALGIPLQSQPDRLFAVDDSYTTRLFTMWRVWPRYFELFLFPLDLSADYSPAVILPASGPTPLGLAGLFLALLILALAILWFRKAPEFSLAVAWAGITLLPVSNLVIMAEIILAERTLYLPSVSVSIIAALALSKASRQRRRWLFLALIVWVAFFSVVTVRRNPVWYSTDTVFEDLRRRHPESSRLLYGVGWQYYRQGKWEEAREWIGRSLEIWPYHAPYLAEFALYLLEHEEYEEADSMAARAIRLNPDFRDYRVLHAVIRVRAGEWQAALRTIEESLNVLGAEALLYTLQADAYAGEHDYDRAIAAREAAMRARQGGPAWRDWYDLARWQVAAGDTAAARRSLESARSAPGAPTAAIDSLAGSLGLLP